MFYICVTKNVTHGLLPQDFDLGLTLTNDPQQQTEKSDPNPFMSSADHVVYADLWS